MNYKDILGKTDDVYIQQEISKALIKDCKETFNLMHGNPCDHCEIELSAIIKIGDYQGDGPSWKNDKFWVGYILDKQYWDACRCPKKIIWKDQNINRAFENAMHTIYEYENNVKKEPNRLANLLEPNPGDTDGMWGKKRIGNNDYPNPFLPTKIEGLSFGVFSDDEIKHNKIINIVESWGAAATY